MENWRQAVFHFYLCNFLHNVVHRAAFAKLFLIVFQINGRRNLLNSLELPIDVKGLQDYETVRPLLAIRLCDPEKNQEYLGTAPVSTSSGRLNKFVGLADSIISDITSSIV